MAVTALIRCEECRLLFRAPRNAIDTNLDFFQREYESGGLTTSLPDATTLSSLKVSGFRGSQKDFTDKIAILNSLGVQKNARVLDYGHLGAMRHGNFARQVTMLGATNLASGALNSAAKNCVYR